MSKHKGCKKHMWRLTRETGLAGPRLGHYERLIHVRCARCGEREETSQYRAQFALFPNVQEAVDGHRNIKNAVYIGKGKRKK